MTTTTQYTLLALAVIEMAMRDARDGDLMARWWLTGNSWWLQFWCSVGNVDPAAVARALQPGDVHRAFKHYAQRIPDLSQTPPGMPPSGALGPFLARS